MLKRIIHLSREVASGVPLLPKFSATRHICESIAGVALTLLFNFSMWLGLYRYGVAHVATCSPDDPICRCRALHRHRPEAEKRELANMSCRGLEA